MDQNELDQQSQHWEKNFSNKPEMFGLEPSISAKKALNFLKEKKINNIIELGSGLGRDSIFFAKNNIKPIDCLNKKLDPNLHQAMMEIEDDNKETGTVVQEIQKGFMMKDRLLRPSLVAVSKKTNKIIGLENSNKDSDKPQKFGTFESAHNGTLFLDEVGDMPTETQGKIVRVLQEQVFERVGGANRIEVDVRVVAS
mgnify:CR=1 FL=1